MVVHGSWAAFFGRLGCVLEGWFWWQWWSMFGRWCGWGAAAGGVGRVRSFRFFWVGFCFRASAHLVFQPFWCLGFDPTGVTWLAACQFRFSLLGLGLAHDWGCDAV